ncbi:MAG: hypothetical protein ACLT76_10845 [Clostridium fessum]
MCSATAFLLLCSGVAPSADMAGMAYVQAAMNNVFGTAGVVFITSCPDFICLYHATRNYYFAGNRHGLSLRGQNSGQEASGLPRE